MLIHKVLEAVWVGDDPSDAVAETDYDEGVQDEVVHERCICNGSLIEPGQLRTDKV